MEADRPQESVGVVIEGPQIGQHAGDAEAIGNAIQRLGKLFHSLGGGNALLKGLVFGNSVTVELRATDAELARVREAWAKVDERLTIQDDEVVADLSAAVPDIHVAAALAAELISASAREAPLAAAQLGSEVAEAYKTLATALAKGQLTIAFQDPTSDQSARISPSKAKRVSEEIRSITEPRRLTVTAFGMLSIADATQQGFGLRLDSDRTRHQALKGKRLVRGTYEPPVGEAIEVVP